ncbi:MAG: RNA polymerase sigma factor [Bacteroidales bacterium]
MLKQLWKQYSEDGNERAFSTLFTLIASDLYSYGTNLGYNSDDVNDAIQDVFINLHCNNKINIKGETIKFYLLRSVKNRLIDIQRAKKPTSELDNTLIEFQLQLSIEDEYINNERIFIMKEQVSAILNQLTDHQKEIIYLRYIEDLDYDQIADILNMNVQNIRGQVFKTLQKLRKLNTQEETIILLLISSYFKSM